MRTTMNASTETAKTFNKYDGCKNICECADPEIKITGFKQMPTMNEYLGLKDDYIELFPIKVCVKCDFKVLQIVNVKGRE